MLITLGIGQVWAEDEVYKTASFTSSSFSASSQSYTGSFNSTTNGFVVAIANANNNNKGWNYIKMCSKSAAVVGTITTNAAIDKAITRVDLTIDAITANNINSITLYTKTSTGSWSSAGTFAKATGVKSVTLSSPAANLLYKIEVDCKKSSNGSIQLSKVEYYIAGSSQTTALSVPTGMSSGTPGMTSATLSWNAVEHADGYALTIGTNDPITSGFTTSNGTVSYTLSNLTADTDYTWKVKATTTNTTTYSNSDDCAVQNFTTADDPSLLSLTFDLTSNPGGWPTANSTTTTNYTYTLNSTAYTFALNNVKCNSGYLMLTSVAKLGLPAISNYKLVKVVASNTSGCSKSTNVAVTSAEAATPVVSGGTAQTWSTQSSTYTYNLSGTAYNTVYYLYVTSANAQVTQLKLKYQAKPAVSSIAIKTAPTKTTYTANENFDPTGLVITVNYANSTSEDVAYNNTTASDFTFSPTTSMALNASHTAVTVTYAAKTANQAITVNRIATSLGWSANSYAANIGSQYSFPTLTKTPSNLSGVTFESSNTDVVETISSAGVPTVKATGTTTITAKFAQTNVYAAATDASYTLTINAASSPSLEADPTILDFEDVAVNESKDLVFALGGEHLTANASLAITGSGKDMFTVASSVAKDGDGNILEDVTVTYAPTAAGSHSATLTISSTGATPVEVALSGTAKVRRTVTWYKADETELTAQERGEATTSVLDGDKVTAIPSAPASCDASISFMGWTTATYAKSDDAPTTLYTSLSDFEAISGGNATYYAVWASASGSDGSIVLNSSTENFPDKYGTANDFDDAELEGYDFKIQQVYVNGDKLQWRASGNQNGTGTIYNNEAFPGHISSVVVVFDGDNNKNHTLKVGDSANPMSGTSITPSVSNTYTYTFDCSAYNADYFVLTNGSNAGYTSSVTINYAAATGNYCTTCSAPVEIAAPTFTPAAGTYTDDQSVEISCATANTTIYYTTDGSSPKTSATKQTYSSAISVTEDKTIMAIATDGNGNWSEVVTKSYVINYSSSIAAFITKAQATSRALKLNAAQNAIITGIREYTQSNTTKYDIYLQDASNKGIIIYGLASLPEGAEANKKIVGTINGIYSLGNGQPRITSATFAEGIQFVDASIEPVSIEAVNSDAYEANPIMLVKLSGVYYNTDSYYFTSQAEGQGTSNYVYDSFKTLNGKTMPANTVACDITGILINYNGNTPELLPLSLTTAATAILPAISPEGGADSEHAVEVTYLSTVSVPLVENEKIYVAVNDAAVTDPIEAAASVQIEGDTKITVTAKRDFYADNAVTYFYKPSAYPKTITKVSAHGTMTVKVGENEVSTALPTSTVKVTISDVESHFTLTGVTVKDADNGDVDVSESAGVYSFTMPNKNVTITANYSEDAHYTITYNAGGASGGSAPAGALTWQYAGEDVTLLANAYTWDAEHVFTGWKVTYGETELDKAVGSTFAMPEANVTITAQWAVKQYCALTLKVNGENHLVANIEQEVEQTISALDGYTAPENVGDYVFFGWAESQENDDVEEAIETIDAFTPALGVTSKTLYAVYKRVYAGAEKTDELTAADLAATSTGYVDFSNVQKNSKAKYAGNTAKNSAGAIQLRSSNNAGIVSTVSGGKIKSVAISVSSGSNTLDIYGSNTAYTGTSDLYGSSKGTKIGSTASTATITPTAQQEFEYVGIRSNSGAIYLSSVSITWQPKTTYYTTHPAEVCDVTYNLGTSPAGAWKENEGCENTKVKSGLTYDICEDEPIREHFTFNGWLIGGQAASGTITITGNTEIVANWVAKVESNLTYNAGTGSGDDAIVANVEEGTEVTMPSADDKSMSKDGYDFKGWLAADGTLYKEGEIFIMPAEAATLVAQWKKQNTEEFVLVTDASQLVNGAKVVLAYNATNAVAGEMYAEGNSYLTSKTGEFNENKSIMTSVGNGIQMTLVQMEGGWALKYNNKYLKQASSNKACWSSDPVAWIININSDSARIERTEGNSSYAIRYNASSGSERFAAYGLTAVKPIQLYASQTAITSNTNISTIGYVEGDVIVVANNATLTIDNSVAPTNVTVKSGSTVVVNSDKNVDANSVIVEKGGKLEISGNVETDEPLVIYTTLGKGTGTSTSGNAPGSSSQIIGASNLTANGDVYMEIELTQESAASAGWYAFSVPFEVDALNGVYFGETKLTNEVGYAIMSHDGALRAENKYAWKKFRGIMQPGVFYVITVGNTDYKTLRFKKVAGAPLAASTSVPVSPFPSQTGSDSDGAWNGIGNPNLAISNLSTSVPTMQFYDHKTNSFIGRSHSVNLVVGSAFFIQYNASSTVSVPIGTTSNNGYLAPKRAGRAVENEIFEISLINRLTEEKEDNVFLSAREEATNSYEIGLDVAKMSLGTAKCAQMTIPAYGTNLCAADFPLVNDKAEYPLTITAPAAGNYRIEATEAYADADIYLTKDGSIIWNLTMSAYELDLEKGTTSEYGLLLQARAPQIATGVEDVQGDKVQCMKVVINDNVFILRGEQLFDVTGKMVK